MLAKDKGEYIYRHTYRRSLSISLAYGSARLRYSVQKMVSTLSLTLTCLVKELKGCIYYPYLEKGNMGNSSLVVSGRPGGGQVKETTRSRVRCSAVTLRCTYIHLLYTSHRCIHTHTHTITHKQIPQKQQLKHKQQSRNNPLSQNNTTKHPCLMFRIIYV